MGKRRGKSRRKRYKYGKKEFVDIICSKCQICTEDSEPSFCFGDAYRNNPKDFVHRIYPGLVEIRKWLDGRGKEYEDNTEDITVFMFKSVFCASDFCGERPKNGECCPHLGSCLQLFKLQVEGEGVLESKSSRRKKRRDKKKKNKKDKRKVYQPYPTFFCNESMKEEVHAILNGNYNKQQNKGEESAGETA
jgi:hypothetical protein